MSWKTLSFLEANSPCQDVGCNSLWGGRGECVSLFHNKWSSIESKYNVSVHPKEITDKILCQPSNMAYKDINRDCCRCFYKPDIPPTKCTDNGCGAKGGLCVNLLDADLTKPDLFPRNTVDLDQRLEEGLCHKPNERHCCDCYLMKNATTN